MSNEQSQGNVLSAHQLSKQVSSPEGTLTILSDVSFSIAAGASVAIVGASGAGKSTLLALLAGLDLPSTGHVSLNGVNLGELDEDGRAEIRASSVGFVFQSFHLVPSLNALENVMLPLELAGRSDARDAARQLIDKVGLGERWSHYPAQLSGGEKQRVALARALFHRPRLLLCDELTGNLDDETGRAIIDVLTAVHQRDGCTVLVVTHDSGIVRVADRVLRLAEGQLAPDAPGVREGAE